MHALIIALVIWCLVFAANVLAQGAIVKPRCEGACGVIQSIVPVTERQDWSPLGAMAPGSVGLSGLGGMSGSTAQVQIGPGFTNQGMVVLGAAGGAAYAKRPNEYRRQRWDVTLKMDSGPPRVISLSYEPLFVQEGDYVRVSGNNLELRQSAGAMNAAALAVTDVPDGRRVLALSGRLDADTIPDLWRTALQAVNDAGVRPVVVDAAGVDYCDGAGIALLVDLLRQPRPTAVAVENLQPKFTALLRQFDPQLLDHDLDPEPPRVPALEEVGRNTERMLRDMRVQIEFLGQATAALASAIRHPSRIRWRDVAMVCERVGADALPIVALISFLLGVILAFQSAVPMKRYGAEIFVADLIGLGMIRELGTLITAILLAGRTGAAFAAELGTMRVNQEIDALTTMGLDPVRFLVITRVIAAVMMTPLLSLFAMLVGMLGGAFTMLSYGIPFVTFVKEVEGIVNFQDFMAGWIKSFVFALAIAGIGCLRGLQTAAGASAVGDSATRAVVSGLVLIVIIDGVFAVIYFMLDI